MLDAMPPSTPSQTDAAAALTWYADTLPALPPRPALAGQAHADVCIIGAGFTGLSAARVLAQAGYDTVVLDAGRIGDGASGRNGGQVWSGMRLRQTQLETLIGRDDAHHVWRITEAAKGRTRRLAADLAPEAGYTEGVIHADWHARDVPDTHANAAHLATAYGYGQVEPLDQIGLRSLVDAPGYAGGALDWGEGALNPVLFLRGLARAAERSGARIFETTTATALQEGQITRVSTTNGRVTARQILLAGNAGTGALAPGLEAKVLPMTSYMAVTAPLSDDRVPLKQGLAVIDRKTFANAYRMTPDNRLMFAGGDSTGLRTPRDIAALVHKPLVQTFPQLKDVQIDYAWGGTIGLTASRLPLVSRLSRHVLAATGYSGHGLALAVFMGEVLAQTIRAQSESFDVLARLPVPDFPGGAKYRPSILAAAMTWNAIRERLGV